MTDLKHIVNSKPKGKYRYSINILPDDQKSKNFKIPGISVTGPLVEGTDKGFGRLKVRKAEKSKKNNTFIGNQDPDSPLIHKKYEDDYSDHSSLRSVTEIMEERSKGFCQIASMVELKSNEKFSPIPLSMELDQLHQSFAHVDITPIPDL